MVDIDKYLYDQELSEETTMTQIDMTGDDYLLLMEDSSAFSIPSPSDTILTNTTPFKSDSESSPLSGLDGEGGSTTEPHEEGKTPSDAPNTPSVASMDDPTRKANIASKKGGTRKNTPAADADGGDASKKSKKSKKSSNPDDGGSDEKSSKPWEKTKEDDDMSKTNKEITLEDYDFENQSAAPEDQYMEHDMAAGEIAVTKEFMIKLLAGVAAANLGEEQFAVIADAIADCSGGDRTLDVDDIEDVMASMQGGADELGGADEYAGDDEEFSVGDDDLEGEEELMGDGAMDEGSEEDRQRGRARHQNRKADKQRERNAPKPKYRKPRADAPTQVSESRRQLDEAWLSAIPPVGNPRKKEDYAGMSDDEAELKDIQRLAGM